MKRFVCVVFVCLLVSGAFGAGSYDGGSGTAGDPYRIATAEQMQSIGLHPEDWDKCFLLVADIDISGYDGQEGRDAFNVIEVFKGRFNGNHHTISGLTFNSPAANNRTAIFAFIDVGSIVENLNLDHVDIHIDSINGSRYPRTAGLAATNRGVIRNCNVKGNVSNNNYISYRNHVGLLAGVNNGEMIDCIAEGTCVGYKVGGLVGENSGDIIRCMSNCSVNGIDMDQEACASGGLVGINYGEIYYSCSHGDVAGYYSSGGLVGISGTIGTTAKLISCYATGRVESLGGWNTAAGLVGGLLDSKIENCYSIGELVVNPELPDGRGGLIGWADSYLHELNSFWDVESSGFGVSGQEDNHAVGKTTADMKKVSTFTGWDFVGGDSDGRMDVWYMPEGDYPRLFWEADAGDCDYDGLVDGGDLGVMGQWWMTCQDDLGADERLLCDFDFDGVVNLGDFMIVAGNWLGDTGL